MMRARRKKNEDASRTIMSSGSDFLRAISCGLILKNLVGEAANYHLTFSNIVLQNAVLFVVRFERISVAHHD